MTVTAWARQNSAELRQLAGQASALTGLSAAGQREADRVHAELAGNDAATLLGPLADLCAGLTDAADEDPMTTRHPGGGHGRHRDRTATAQDRLRHRVPWV